MQKYLNQLLNDLELALKLAPETSSYAFRSPFMDEESSMSEALRVRQTKLSELFGLDSGIFPPVEMLTKKQVTAILLAIERLCRAWNIELNSPPGLTARKRYNALVGWMEKEQVDYHPDFGTEINFCANREAGICPMGDDQNCHCAKVEAEQAKYTSQNFEPPTETPLKSPVDELNDWIRGEHTDRFLFSDYQHDEGEWRQFMAEEDQYSWLFFYHPERQAEVSGDYSDTDSDAFEDFEWESEEPDYLDDDMPF